ncbi:MAG: TIR domain-containing protein [Alphaproteobacteria bacterium]|nr:TIR domain-containing protein [Alphaproteobacteria bacterium]
MPENPASTAGPPTPPTPPALPQHLRLRGRPLQTSQDVADYLGIRHRLMIDTLYNQPPNARYRHFEIPKRTGGMRPIHAPVGHTRAMQDRLLTDFKALYRPHPNAHGFIEKRSVTSNATCHTGQRWVLNIDLEGFFPSINFGRVRGLFMRPPFEMGQAAATVCAQIVTFRNGLPQGAPTSPVLSNFIAAQLDRTLSRLARQNRLVYSRYADDITFSTNLTQFPASVVVREMVVGGGYKVRAGDALELAIQKSGFEINEKKVRLQAHYFHQDVTGLCVNERVNVARERVRKLRAMLHAWRKFGLERAGQEHFAKHRGSRRLKPPSQPGAAFRNVVYGNLSFVKMVRGADDPVFLKLCAQVLALDPNPSKFLRQMVYGADDYDVFISHASEDKEAIARPLFEACNRLGLKAFLDEAHIGFGQSFAAKINTALGASRTILAVVTPHSTTKDWPLQEINTALALEISGEKKVVPVMVGSPDLTHLPLLRTKRWISWEGNADSVIRQMKQQVGPLREAKKAGSVPGIAGKKAARPVPQAKPMSGAQSQTTPRSDGWISRLFGKK